MKKQLTDNEHRVLACLKDAADGCVEIKADGTEWAEVYLDNARPYGMSVREFDGTLSSLAKKGLYKDQGGDCFGTVKLDQHELKNELSL